MCWLVALGRQDKCFWPVYCNRPIGGDGEIVGSGRGWKHAGRIWMPRHCQRYPSTSIIVEA